MILLALGVLAGASSASRAEGWRGHTPWPHIERAERRPKRRSGPLGQARFVHEVLPALRA